MPPDSSPSGPPPAKLTKRQKKALEREALLDKMVQDGVLGGEAERLVRKKVGLPERPAKHNDGTRLPALPANAAGLTDTAGVPLPDPSLPVTDPSKESTILDVSPEEGAGIDSGRHSRHPTAGRPKKGSRFLYDFEKEKIISSLKAGMNRALAVSEAGISYERFVRELQHNNIFKSDVIVAENSCDGIILAMMFDSAVSERDIAAGEKFINIRQGARDRVLNRRLKLEEMKMRRQVVNHSMGVARQESGLDFSCFTEEEFNDYMILCDKVEAGDENLTDDETARFGRYSIKISQHAKKKQLPPAINNYGLTGELAGEGPVEEK